MWHFLVFWGLGFRHLLVGGGIILSTTARMNFQNFCLSTLVLSLKHIRAPLIMTKTLPWPSNSRIVLSHSLSSFTEFHAHSHSMLWPRWLHPFPEHILLSLVTRLLHMLFPLPGKPFCTSQLPLIPQISAPFCILRVSAQTFLLNPLSHHLVAPSLFPSEYLAHWWLYLTQNYFILSLAGLKGSLFLSSPHLQNLKHLVHSGLLVCVPWMTKWTQ